ncbi:3-hydroxyisobutyrate dehydrogenase [Salinisphaera sp. PC39]|uniref:3-hydroxyisobutyrate dehydrogenase n=1 Tax=Salinisphaera sp. PC39 TaxID=1304156 RepID=UPI0033425BC2
MATIGFIGLGNMGGPMAANLLAAGHTLKVFDLDPALAEPLIADGATLAETPGDTVAGVDVLVSMLPNGDIVKDLYIRDQALLDRIDPATLVIDSSTIAAEDAREVHEAAKARGVGMIDAPVSGGVGAAKSGKLTFICGGDAEDVDRGREVLGAMGKAVFRAGPSGAGQVAKICNNMLLAVHMIGTAEALALGARAGLDPKAMTEIMAASSGRNWSLDTYNPWPGVQDGVPAGNGYEGGFLVKLMNKDLGLAAAAAERLGAETPMGELARKLYGEHAEASYADKDFSSILERFRNSE